MNIKESYRNKTKNGTGYNSNPTSRKLMEIAIGLVNNGNRSVIDLGSGNCSIMKKLMEMGAEVLGIDFIRYPGSINTIIHDLDVIPYPIKSESYDIAICSEVLPSLQYPCDLLEESARILKPGGTIIIDTINSFPLMGRNNVIKSSLVVTDICHTGLETMLKYAGFTDSNYYKVGKISSKLKFLPISWFNSLLLTARKAK